MSICQCQLSHTPVSRVPCPYLSVLFFPFFSPLFPTEIWSCFPLGQKWSRFWGTCQSSVYSSIFLFFFFSRAASHSQKWSRFFRTDQSSVYCNFSFLFSPTEVWSCFPWSETEQFFLGLANPMFTAAFKKKKISNRGMELLPMVRNRANFFGLANPMFTAAFKKN